MNSSKQSNIKKIPNLIAASYKKYFEENGISLSKDKEKYKEFLQDDGADDNNPFALYFELFMCKWLDGLNNLTLLKKEPPTTKNKKSVPDIKFSVNNNTT